MLPAGAAFVAVDWGTTRLRAYLIGADGEVLDRALAAESGIQSIPAGGFPAALDAACSRWFSESPDLPVLMAGMVGSRNGWAEAAYAAPPCDAATLASKLLAVSGAGRPVFIIPGVDCPGSDGSYDVMRGEETQAVGVGLSDGLVCLPGTHSKWVEIVDGRINRFATFMTGELYAAMLQSFIGRLAGEPEDRAGGDAVAARLAGLPGGLPRTLFQARAQVLGGGLSPGAVRPYLSSLLIEAEVRGARDLFGADRPVHLVAGSPQLEAYSAVLARAGCPFDVYDPETATVAGLVRLAVAAGLAQPAFAAERT